MDAQSTSLDTFAEAERVVIDKLRAMSPADRRHSVRELALAGVRQRYPNASVREQLLRLAVTIHGRDRATRAYPEIATLDL